MLTSLRLQNFQSYLDTTITLDPHFNLVKGVGHTGKSVWVRALVFLLYGQWDTEWLTWGQTVCTVTGKFTDGSTLVRKKGDKINEYILRVGEVTKKYQNFGVSVPQEIQEYLKLYALDFPPNIRIRLNLHEQFDSPLLQLLSGPSHAKLLGRLSNLDVLDQVGLDLLGDKKAIQIATRAKEEEVEQLSQDLQRLSFIPYQTQKLAEVKDSIQLISDQVDQLNLLKSIKIRTDNWKQLHKSIQDQLHKLPQAPVQNFAQIEASLQLLNQLQQLAQQVTLFKDKHRQVVQMLTEVTSAREEIKQRYSQLIQQVQQCPLCGSSVTTKCVQEILASI